MKMKRKALIFTIACLAAAIAIGTVLPLALSGVAGEFTPNATVGAAYMTTIGLLFLILIVEIVSVFKIDDSTFHTALLAGCLFAMYACSADTYIFFFCYGLRIPDAVLGVTSELAFVFSELSCVWYMCYLYKIRVDSRTASAVAVPVVVAVLGYATAFIYNYAYIAHFILALILSTAFCQVIVLAEKRGNFGPSSYGVIAIYALAMGAQSANALLYSGPAEAIPGLTLGFAILTFAMFIFVYLAFSIRTDVRAVRSDAYKQQAATFETRALTLQIKPHFIFNSLEALRALYHKDLALGDEGLSRLSDFLRGSIGSFDSDLIPFETEIDNIYNYTEFENLKRDEGIEVIFDIDYTDFVVPPFSIQPFVENAFKYSGVEKTGGRVVISSYREENRVIVGVSDNGKGFDPSAISERSHGIRNACERFALALDARPEIKSEPGKGTTVKIVIDIARRGGVDE